MEIQDIVIYKGRNIYSHHPTMKLIVNIDKYNDIPTKDIQGFNEMLLDAFPNLKKNTCGLGYEGGFLKRLYEGTYLAHVLEHVILDMQNTLGYDVKYGKTRLYKSPSIYYTVFEYDNEVCALECSKAAVFILNCFIKGLSVNVKEYLEYLKKISLDTNLGPSTQAIVDEARKRNIPITRIGHDSLVQLGYGRNARLIESTLTDVISCISADIASNKQLAKSILYQHKVHVPYGKKVFSEISAVMAAKQIGMPVVIKPFDSNQGKGVNLKLNSEEEIRNAFKESSKYSSGILVEQYIEGNDYRILVVGDKVVAVAERQPACVTGDGSHSIRELVDIINSDPNRGNNHEKRLTKIKLDNVVQNVLAKKGLNIDYIPQKGEVVKLRENGNLSTGGTAIDRTDEIHPDNAEIAVRAANAIGIDIAGIDIVAPDISKSIYDTGGAVIEVNASPGIRMHLYPSEGKPRNVAKDIVDFLYPGKSSGNIPIVSVTGTNGKTTTVRLISHVLQFTGMKVGMTSTDGTFINEKCICPGDNSGPISARTLLSNRNIDAAVLETARGGIIRGGLGYDLADVGIVTNINRDHLKMDGVETLEDLAFVKSLVAEAVKPNGYAVLNAEDPMTEYVLKRIKCRAVLFYQDLSNIKLSAYKNYPNVYIDNGFICVKDKNYQKKIVRVDSIPITFGGMLKCNIDNCLAAVSALYALNIPPETISKALMNFKDNAGRFNIFDMGEYKIMLDYAHNKAGYEEVLNLCNHLPRQRLVGVIGVPGDREDDMIADVGKISAEYFDYIYIKEDQNPRGRQKNEVANLLYNAAISSGFNGQNLKIINSEAEALKYAMEHARKGDLIVVLYERLEPLVEIIETNRTKKALQTSRI